MGRNRGSSHSLRDRGNTDTTGLPGGWQGCEWTARRFSFWAGPANCASVLQQKPDLCKRPNFGIGFTDLTPSPQTLRLANRARFRWQKRYPEGSVLSLAQMLSRFNFLGTGLPRYGTLRGDTLTTLRLLRVTPVGERSCLAFISSWSPRFAANRSESQLPHITGALNVAIDTPILRLIVFYNLEVRQK
jgi:hypothetical protein